MDGIISTNKSQDQLVAESNGPVTGTIPENNNSTPIEAFGPSYPFYCYQNKDVITVDGEYLKE